ncbi:chorismate mutase [Jeotgalibacillus sp. S-D1]|uniref:chorismate mutase n=1 Tax=Jeotgalibacillus sp. S-D1 TaxID=2552189 RepID=UPI001059E092|nr:chorismate mutase [Jeotgalibacillus sp. S-D1]TDL34737.1 chorismate mutase [Jeotgalibacillus sp. S-D1]
MIRGIRGATTVTEDQEDLILSATEALLQELIEANDIAPSDVASVFISVTNDLSSAFPAKAVRKFENWTYVPVMCMQEIPVSGSLPYCIRLMMHVNTSESQERIQHIYQQKAVQLRPDLSETAK